MNFWSRILIFFILSVVVKESLCKRKTIDDVTVKALEPLIQNEQFVAVYWYGKNCKTCDRILSQLEKIVPELEESGIKIVKLNDKKTAKRNGILSFPAISYFKGGQPVNYEGDIADNDEILNFLASPEAMDMPDQIEAVNGQQLQKLIQEKSFLTVLFYTQHPESLDILSHMELIDEKADRLGVAIVKINDLEVIDEYQFAELPALVYYRHTTPLIYEGDLSNEEDVLDWIIHNKSTGDEDDVIEEVTIDSLEALMTSVNNLAVLFYDPTSRKADQLLETMEKLDDDCDTRGVYFVKINSDGETGEAYGIQRLPTLVFFKNEVPNLFEGNLMDGPAVLQWIYSQVETDQIEEITGTMLDRLIRDTKRLVVLFCKYFGYGIIALIHTCYLLRHYDPNQSSSNNFPPDKVLGLAMEQ